MKNIIEYEKDFDGYKHVALMTHMGHRCGYVGIPSGHPLHGEEK